MYMIKNPQTLLSFLSVVEAGSFQAAADRMNMDRSVLSRRIAALEAELGTRLLQRSTRALSVTAAGQGLLVKARCLRDLLNEVQQIAEDSHETLRGRLRVTAPTHFGHLYVQEALERFLFLHPEVEGELRLEDRFTPLVAEGFDVAIRIGEPEDSSLVARKLVNHSLEIVAAPEFLTRHGTPGDVAELVKLPALAYRSEGVEAAHLHYLDRRGKRHQAPMNIVYWSNSGQMLRQSAVVGLGWAILSTFLCHRDLREGTLVRLLPKLKLPDYAPIYLVTSHRDLPRRTRAFIDVLRQVVGNPPVWGAAKAPA
jgi:DNA-binding transcriptional LysR family regulator